MCYDIASASLFGILAPRCGIFTPLLRDQNQYPLHWKVKSATGPPGQLQGIWFSDEDWNPPDATQAQWGWDGESKGLVRLAAGLLDLLKFSPFSD